MLGQVSQGQVRLGYVRLGQVRLGQVRLGQVRLGEVRLGQVRLGQVRLGQVRLGQFRIGNFYMWCIQVFCTVRNCRCVSCYLSLNVQQIQGANLLLDTFAFVYGSGLTLALISSLNIFALISSQLHFDPNINSLFSTRNICWEPKRAKRIFCHL